MTTRDERERAAAKRKLAIDAAIEDCRGRPISDAVAALQLKMEENSGWLGGPCPVCGGEDRFQINISDNGFFCRKGCEAKGSGAIDLVMVVQRLEFLDAVKFLAGEFPDEIDEAEIQRRRDLREKSQREKDEQRAKYRAFARKDAQSIWSRTKDHGTGQLRTYLARRGITRDLLPELPKALRFIPDHAYVVNRKVDEKKTLITMHRGPAMIAAVQAPDDKLICAHQTWFDLTRPGLKPEIIWQGKPQRNKLTRGSQSRGAIRLVTPRRFDTIVMAEGIETTLSAAIAWREDLGPDVAFWAGISLPHMAGKMAKVEGQRYSGIPRMDDPDGFVPPPWVTRLIFIQDGDSDATATKAQLQSGLRRAMAFNDKLLGQIVHAGEGVDLNDVLVGT